MFSLDLFDLNFIRGYCWFKSEDGETVISTYGWTHFLNASFFDSSKIKFILSFEDSSLI